MIINKNNTVYTVSSYDYEQKQYSSYSLAVLTVKKQYNSYTLVVMTANKINIGHTP